jgi:hypothetical protein
VSRPAKDPICPHCGAPHEPNQEYCLECGSRLQPPDDVRGKLAASWRDRLGWYPGDWIWPALLALLVAVAGAIAAIALSDAGAGSGPMVATQGGPAHMPTTSPVTATVALPRVPAGTPTGPPSTPTRPPPATTTGAAPGSLISWPGSRSGFTVIVESVPRSSGRTLALARAREASRAGLPEVGILDSSRYSSLHPGYYVVFSGVYTSQGAAEDARTTASSKGFDSAYTKEITP